MVQIRRHIHLLLYFDIVKHKQCTVDYTNKQVDSVKESKGQKKFKRCFFIRNYSYFDCSFCWLGINVQTGIIHPIPSLIKLGFVVMGYFLLFNFFLFLLHCCCFV